jgi:hypothetical protein
MRPRQPLALVPLFALALALALWVPACDKGGGGSGTVAVDTGPVVRRPSPPPQVEADCPGQCFTLIAGLNEYPRMAVWSVGYGSSDYLQLKNLSRRQVSFDGWYAVTGDNSEALPEGIRVEQGAYVTLWFGESGRNTNENVYLPSLSLDSVGEIALYENDEFQNADAMRVYVRWGADPVEGERSYMRVADEAELWRSRGYVPVCEGYSQFGAVGDNTLPRGFRSMADECFPTRGGGSRGGFPGR